MPRPEKVATVEEIRSKLESARAAVLTEYRGLTVTDLATLRASLRAADAEYKIFKNTLARRAAEEAGLNDLAGLLDGPTAIAFVRGDAVIVAKALRDYAKTNPALVLKGGILGTRIIGSDDVVALADIEPREVLLAKIAGCFQAPLVKAAGLFQAFTRNMAYGLKALIDQRVAAGESLPESAEPEAPAAEAPAAEAPEVEAPEVEAPEVEAPEAEAPEAEAPEAEAPEAAALAPETEAEAEVIPDAPSAATVDGPVPADVAAEPAAEAEAPEPPAAPEAEAAPAPEASAGPEPAPPPAPESEPEPQSEPSAE